MKILENSEMVLRVV